MALFNRSWRLTIDIDGVAKTYQERSAQDTSLKIDFEIDSSVGGAFSNGTITIFGLSNADIAFLATNYNPQDGSLKPSLVQLELGYNDALSLVLFGNIVEAEPDFTQSDTRIRIRVASGAQQNLEKRSITASEKDATFRSLCEIAAKNNDLALEYDSNIPQKTIGDYSFVGTPFQQIEGLRKLYPDADIFINGKKLVVSYKKASEVRKIVLDRDSGLIGTPKPTPFGVEATSMLNPALAAASFIELKSGKIPQINGLYRIATLSHKGSNRGELWISQLTLNKAF